MQILKATSHISNPSSSPSCVLPTVPVALEAVRPVRNSPLISLFKCMSIVTIIEAIKPHICVKEPFYYLLLKFILMLSNFLLDNLVVLSISLVCDWNSNSLLYWRSVLRY